MKAKCQNQDKIRAILVSQQADFKGIDCQIDTYFKVAKGRLKLREGNVEKYLVYYEREDQKGPKQSNVILHKTKPDSSLKEILTASLGVLVIVEKKREIYFLDNVKFHIDDVKGLGYFVEIEAIDYDGTLGKKKLLNQCEHFLKMFDISTSDLISVSYSDLILQRTKNNL
jgi:adenylate cyclase, class 2